jgi:hypothetical protein
VYALAQAAAKGIPIQPPRFSFEAPSQAVRDIQAQLDAAAAAARKADDKPEDDSAS